MLIDGLAKKGRSKYPIPTLQRGYCSLRFASMFSQDAKDMLPLLNRTSEYVNQKSRKILGITYERSEQELLTETAMSLIKCGAVPDR